MTAYVVAAMDVHDLELYAEYRERAGTAMGQFALKSLVRSPLQEAPVVYEGTAPDHVVVLEFESMDDIDAFYHSPGYQDAVRFRLEAARSHFFLALRAR